MMTYSVEELIAYMRQGSVTLKNIAMLKNLALFSSDELMQFITSGVCTFEDMKRCGLHLKKQAELRERLQLWVIERSLSSLKYELLEDMLHNPLKYTPHMMRALLKGEGNYDPTTITDLNPTDVASQFINTGCTITFQELLDRGIIPPKGIEEHDLMATEFELPQTKNLNDFPQDRTDIYFLGVPRSGKSSVLAGLFNAMTKRGNWRYVPNINEQGYDNSLAYFNGLVNSVSAKKPPVPTAHETINYINIDVPQAAGTKRTAHLNFVEISGECFKDLASSLGDSRDMWQSLGASKVLANTNRKVLFFLLDYNTILGNQYGITKHEQEEALNNALIILSNDGPNRMDPEKGCTMSKVESVGVIMTKADLMPTSDPEKRLNIALDYLRENFSSFMSRLSHVCKQFGINKKQGKLEEKEKKKSYLPYIFTFSLGEFYPGNTLLFNYKNSMELASHIERLVPTERGWNPF